MLLSILLCSAVRVGKATYLPKPLPMISLVAPVHNKLSVTGSFGELRNNHFHAGLDLRSTYGAKMDYILAAADGFVKKIKVDSKNYGNSLYIEHPSGHTTVYAHLNRFREDIQERIKAEQYRTHQNELEIEFEPNDFKVSAGDSVAFMGNTGDSRGAHLHFELRITGTEEVLDPTEFGMPVEDNISPQVRKLKLYGFDLDGQTVSQKVYPSNKLQGKVLVPGEVFALGVEAIDRSDHSWRALGIKSLQLYIDHGLFYSFSLDHWSLTETRYINAHLDYKSLHQGRFHRCFKLQGNKIPIYKTVENDGFFYIGDGLEHLVQLVISDARGNESVKEFIIQNSPFVSPVLKKPLPINIAFDKDWNYDYGFGNFQLKQGSVYDHLDCRVDTLSTFSGKSFTPWIGLVPGSEPLHKELEIALIPTKSIPDRLVDKCIVALKRGNSYVSLDGNWDNKTLRAKSKSFGYFAIVADTIPPRLFAKNFKFKMTGKKYFSFGMADNIPNVTSTRSGIKYNAFIDGQWVILHHDLKSHTITHEFEPWLSTGAHDLLVVLEDSRQNKKEYHFSFYR